MQLSNVGSIIIQNIMVTAFQAGAPHLTPPGPAALPPSTGCHPTKFDPPPPPSPLSPPSHTTIALEHNRWQLAGVPGDRGVDGLLLNQLYGLRAANALTASPELDNQHLAEILTNSITQARAAWEE